MRYYIYPRGEVLGPFEADEIAGSGDLTPELLVSLDDGDERWFPARDIPELAARLIPKGEKKRSTVVPCGECGAPVAFRPGVAIEECPYCSSRLSRPGEGETRVNIECSACGGELEYSEGMLGIRCAYCNQAFFLSGRETVLRYLALPGLTADDARERMEKAVREAEGEYGGFKAPRLVHAAFWYYSNITYHWKIKRRRTHEKELTRKEERFIFPDLASEAMGLSAIHPDQMHLVLVNYDGGPIEGGEVIHPHASDDAALRQAKRLWGVKDTRDDQNEYHISSSCDERLALVYYPFFVSEYEWKGEKKTVIADARRGFVTNILWGDIERLDGADEAGTRGRTVLISSSCNHCGREMPVGAFDRVIVCPGCASAWKIRGDGAERIEYLVARPAAEYPGRRIDLPYWIYPFAVKDPGPLSAAPDIGRLIERISSTRFSLPAFRTRARISRNNDLLAEALFEGGVEIDAEPGSPEAPLSITISSGAAGEIFRSFLIALLPRLSKKAVEFVRRCEAEMGEPRLVFIPAYEGVGEIRDGIFGRRLRREALGL